MKKVTAVLLITVLVLFSGCSKNKDKKVPEGSSATSSSNVGVQTPKPSSTPEATKAPQATKTPEASKAPTATVAPKETPKTQDSTDKGTVKTKEQAVNLVKEYLKSKGEYIPSVISVDSEDDKVFTVHCYDIIGKGTSEQHTATSGWYTVDKVTGDIKSLL